MIRTGRIIEAVILLVALSACGHTAPSQTASLGDGTRGWRITCGGMFLSNSDCYDKASYLCTNHTYKIVRETDISPPTSTYFWNAAGAHEILVKCESTSHV